MNQIINPGREPVQPLFKGSYNFFHETGDIARFTGRLFKEWTKPRQEFEEFLRQCYWVGYKSFPLVAITALIMGLVLTIQSRPTLVEFGAESLLPAMVAVSLVREISPVITALICAGKIGSGMGAELVSCQHGIVVSIKAPSYELRGLVAHSS